MNPNRHGHGYRDHDEDDRPGRFVGRLAALVMMTLPVAAAAQEAQPPAATTPLVSESAKADPAPGPQAYRGLHQDPATPAAPNPGSVPPPPSPTPGPPASLTPPPMVGPAPMTIPLENAAPRTVTPLQANDPNNATAGSIIKAPETPAFPTVIPIEPPAPSLSNGDALRSTLPGKSVDLKRDSTGLIPENPPGPNPPRTVNEINADLSELIDKIKDPEAELALVVGQNRVLQSKRTLRRIAISNPAIADFDIYEDDPKLINLVGKAFGNTTLTLWDREGRAVSFVVRVTLDTRDLEARIKQAFPGAAIHIRQIGPQIIMDGQVTDSKMMSEVLQVVTAELRNSFGLRVQSGGGAGQSGTGATTGGAAGTSGTSGSGTSGGGSTGGGGGGGISPQTVGGAGGGGSGGGVQTGLLLINRVIVPGPRQIVLKVKIAELNRTAIRQLGVNWLDTKNNAILGSQIASAGSVGSTTNVSQSVATGAKGALGTIGSTFTANGTAAPASSQLFGVFNAGQFNIFLNALRSNALAKILAEPEVLAADGQPAQFQAGGQFPYPVPQSSSIPGGTAVVTLQFKDFGAILTFLPTILPNDVIRLDVEPVFSALNYGAGTTINNSVVPGIDLRRVRTVVELREGQTLAIAGLLQTLTNSSTVRVPGLGDLPIVGPIFSQNKTEKVETELIVLVTPEFVAPMEANEVPPAPGDMVYDPNDYEFFFLGRIEGKLGRDYRATVAEHDPLHVMKHFQSEDHWVIGPHGHSD